MTINAPLPTFAPLLIRGISCQGPTTRQIHPSRHKVKCKSNKAHVKMDNTLPYMYVRLGRICTS